MRFAEGDWLREKNALMIAAMITKIPEDRRMPITSFLA
jgi:hypothetical protein